jgi:putative ABC transport system permease protein
MTMLDRKLLRDVRRLWAQSLAIALVMASGVATFILANGAHESLLESRTAYYERNRFADVFASATRAPLEVASRIRQIPGVSMVEPRIVRYALLDLPGVTEPATGLAVSLPDHHPASLNQLYLREGRLPEAGRVDEVAVNEAFAIAHGFHPGASVKAILNGRMRELKVVGIALSPEFIYAIGPGDLMPDDRRFGVLWMSEKALASLFDLDGAFNNVTLKLLAGTNPDPVLARLDKLLERYGGTGSYLRKDQVSHAFIDAELTQLAALARVMPPIFLAVSAFLINITLSRLVALEREQIGLFKALGLSDGAIIRHYVEFVLVIVAVGVTIGSVAGVLLAQGLTRLYTEFFHFPFLIFQHDTETYIVAAMISCVAALAGSFKAVRDITRLAPAVAMRPPAPPRFQLLLPRRPEARRRVSPITAMTFRRMARAPLRSALTVLGLAFAVALLVTALQSFDSVEMMVDVAFNQTDRQQATINFFEPKGPGAVEAVERLPGVTRAEPYRSLAVRLRHGPRERKISIIGKPDAMDLSRVLDLDLAPVRLPQTGIALSKRVAEILGVERGDKLEIEVLEGRRRHTFATVTDIIESYFGLTVYLRLDELDRLAGEGPRVSGIHISYDTSREGELFAAIKRMPTIASIALQRRSLAKFRTTLAQNIDYMVTVYVTLATLIAFGIVYNSARIQLSERGRELASLRVLGFTRAEVSGVLLAELAVLTLIALPIGWLIGYGFGWLVIQSFSSDLYRAPFTVERSTFSLAALVVLAAAAVSAMVVRVRVDRLDLIAVLKTRE